MTETLVGANDSEIVLTGALGRSDHETYVELPFDVPAGVRRLTVEFSYTGREQRTTIDLGLFDPQRFRGWSGGDKASFTLSAIDATPSYLPGPIDPGRWTLVLGVPNIRPGVTASYQARIRFGRGEATAVSAFSDAPLEAAPRWYRGDLHMHTCHSDGSVARQSGDGRSPGPVYRTVEAAAARGVDFIAVTDHNAVSHHHALRELQPAFDRLLLIPGVEITTFRGHAGVLGAVGFVEFRLGSRHLPSMRELQDAVARQHGLFIINHPCLPSNEHCMGCGWTAEATEYARIDAVEVVNGGAVRAQGGVADGPFSGIPFWEARLNQGHRITAVGGSDNHQPDGPVRAASAVGSPNTVVFAGNLSERAILDAIRAGRVFIDVEGVAGRTLELTATCDGSTAAMGQGLAAPAGAPLEFAVRIRGAAGARLDVVMDGRHDAALPRAMIGDGDALLRFSLVGDGARHWIRADVRAADSARTLMIGNPIYLEP
ncbi:MAG TPA: CehA/McbA family metallohydrolase [Caulobacteraceae bacterium]|nr:CehA/McbA family metallohydrolase [Caulobacteraceae bacterium]